MKFNLPEKEGGTETNKRKLKKRSKTTNKDGDILAIYSDNNTSSEETDKNSAYNPTDSQVIIEHWFP